MKRPPSPYNGKGLPPECAVYATQTDHRSQVQRADARRAKAQRVKLQRELDKRIIEDPELLPKIPKSSYQPVAEFQKKIPHEKKESEQDAKPNEHNIQAS